MRKWWHFVVVNGYGCHETRELRRYLDGVIRFINEREPEYLILCGGATHKKSAPGRTEAAVMAIYIRERLTHVPEFILDDESLTTLENVKNAARCIRTRPGLSGEVTYGVFDHWSEFEVTVFCEAQRSLKILMLYWFLLPELRWIHKRIRVRTYSWELAHPLKELASIIYNLLALFIPGIASYAHYRRLKQSRTQ